MDKGMNKFYLSPSWDRVKEVKVLCRWRGERERRLKTSEEDDYKHFDSHSLQILSAGVFNYMYRNLSPTRPYLVSPHDARHSSCLCVTGITSRPTLHFLSHLSFFCLSDYNSTFFCSHLSSFAILMTNKLKIKTLKTSQSVIDLCLFSAGSSTHWLEWFFLDAGRKSCWQHEWTDLNQIAGPDLLESKSILGFLLKVNRNKRQKIHAAFLMSRLTCGTFSRSTKTSVIIEPAQKSRTPRTVTAHTFQFKVLYIG